MIGQAKVPGPDSFVPFQRKHAAVREQQLTGIDRERTNSCSFREHKRAKAAALHNAQPGAVSVGGYSVPVSSVLSAARPRLVGQITPQSLAAVLWQDQTGFAICSGNWTQLVAACEVALCTAGDAFALRTAQQDVYNWKSWTTYCKKHEC